MDLIGALGNQANQDKLKRMAELRQRLLKTRRGSLPPTEGPQPRPGEIAKAVDEVLAQADGPMLVADIHRECELLLGYAVNRKTVKAYLSEWALADKPRFKRMKRGHYRLL